MDPCPYPRLAGMLRHCHEATRLRREEVAQDDTVCARHARVGRGVAGGIGCREERLHIWI
jgi:hypothetical protein